MSEAQFQRRVIETAKWYGWLVHHSRPARNSDGSWSTPIDGDPGLPDLVLARDGVVLLVELKKDKGRPSKGQLKWLAALGVHGRLWRPANWDEALAELSAQRRAA
jgi:hypothetical protein